MTTASAPAACPAPFMGPDVNSVRLKSVLDGTFRANPGYELLPFDRLSAGEQELFSSLKNDPGLYGILRPREGTGLAAKSACLETGALFALLGNPGRLPPSILENRNSKLNQQVAELVLDGVLQILHNNELVDGPRAFAAVCQAPAAWRAANEISRMSHDALRYAETLPFRDASVVSARLYSWGRIPASSFWNRKFPNEQAVRECLRVSDGAENALRLASRWKVLPPDPNNDGWLFWQALRPLVGGSPAYKLYVSPQPAFLRDAFEAMIPALERTGANAFKVGKDVAGILRPDKMIAYFAHLEQAQEAAERIFESLRDCPAHGVPFTAQLASPMVSWGSDPPGERNVPPWLERQSWRLWVSNRLAVSLTQALRQKDTNPDAIAEPWKYAIDRLSLDGVDTNTWSHLRKEEN